MPVPCPSLLSVPVEAGTLLLLATPLGPFVLRGGPQIAFPVVPKARGLGGAFPAVEQWPF